MSRRRFVQLAVGATLAGPVVAAQPSAALAAVATPTSLNGSARLAADYPRSVIDAFGRRTIINSADRIVVFMPPVSDAVYGLGQGSRIVGRTDFTPWPPEVQHVPSIGEYTKISAEGVLGLAPDALIITEQYASFEGTVGPLGQLRDAGVSVLIVPDVSLAEREGRPTLAVLEETVRLIADALAVPERGAELISQMRAAADEAMALVPERDAPLRIVNLRAFTPTRVFTSGQMSAGDLLIRMVGGVNPPADEGLRGLAELGPEALARMNPDIILGLSQFWQSGQDGVTYHRGVPGVETTAAGQAGRIVPVDNERTSAFTWRIAEQARELARALAMLA